MGALRGHEWGAHLALAIALTVAWTADGRPLRHKTLHRHGVHAVRHVAGLAYAATAHGKLATKTAAARPGISMPVGQTPPALAATAVTPAVLAPAPPSTTLAPRVGVYKPACDPAPTREDAEYCEQAKAADAAGQSARWALGQFVVGLLGVIAIVLILWFTKRAADAAAKAARVAEKALFDLERPYVFVHGMHGVEALPQDEYRPRIVYDVSNHGKLAAKIDTVSIACGPGKNGSLPPLRMQDRHCLLERPILSVDEQRTRIVHDLSGENFISRSDAGAPSAIAYDVDDGVVFQVLIEYRGPAGQSHETGQVWKYDRESGGWCEIADPHHTYMT